MGIADITRLVLDARAFGPLDDSILIEEGGEAKVKTSARKVAFVGLGLKGF